MLAKPKLYFISNLGYSELTIPIIGQFVIAFQAMGFEVLEQFKRTEDIEDPILLAEKIKTDVAESDVVFAFLNGEPADGGVFTILGYAAGLKKEVSFYRDDRRKCTDSDLIFANLMMAVGFNDEATLQHHCYEKFEELSERHKFLAVFAANFQSNVTEKILPKRTLTDKISAYLANYYGFSASMKATLLADLQKTIENTGIVVLEPFHRANDVITTSGFDPFVIANNNAKDIDQATIVIAVMNGEPVDVGICFELGYAASLGIPCFLLRDDFRMAGAHKDFSLNPIIAMVFQDFSVLKKRFCTSTESLVDALRMAVAELNVETEVPALSCT